MSDLAQLLVPALRWNDEKGYVPLVGDIDEHLALGVGGFILFGGNAESARRLTARLRAAARHPLLIGADLERGAGQQFAGCTGLPPFAALGSLGDLGAVASAARVTAREALALGINWVYAPVADLDIEPDNPIVGTRSPGADPARVADTVTTWVDACQAEGALACVKHFPGHGRTVTDSHEGLPVVEAPRRELDRDLTPFRAAMESGVASVMSAHVAFRALDPALNPATCSPLILRQLLREELGYDGLVVTDAMNMAGVRGKDAKDGEGVAGVRALGAGCDLLLYPTDPAGVLRAIKSAVDRTLPRKALDAALARRDRWARWARQSPPAVDGESGGNGKDAMGHSEIGNSEVGARIADRCVHLLRGPLAPTGLRLSVAVVDDDLGGPFPPPARDPFFQSLGAAGVDVARHDDGVPTPESHRRAPLVIALFGDIRAWKGRPGYSEKARRRVDELIAHAKRAARDAFILQFSHPRLAVQLPPKLPIVCAWGGERPMQEAAARWLRRRAG